MGKRIIHAVLRTAAKQILGVAIGLLFVPIFVEAQERRGRRTPGLVLETGARHATCDVVLFTPSGDELLTAGDDKVVRQWKVGKDGVVGEAGRILRWPILRERRGGIHAIALSPDTRQVAVTGYGVKNGLVMVFDRTSGEVVHVLDDIQSSAVNWAITWSPDARYLVFGNEYGELFRWEPGAKADTLHRFAGKQDGTINRIRLVAFVNATNFLSVAQDGKVWKRDVRTPNRVPDRPLATFEGRPDQKIASAAFSPVSNRLAVCQGYRPGHVPWLDLNAALTGSEAGKTKTNFLRVPEDKQTRRYAWSVSFNATGDKLAVGTRDATEGENLKFSEVIGGTVFVYSLAGADPKFLTSRKGLDCGYAVDALAFRPGTADQLASAGGPNHEVRLWAYSKPTPLAEIRSPGSCLWSVAVDANEKYLAWREQPNRKPTHANDRGDGGWRYFKLDRSKRHILADAPPDFKAVTPVNSIKGWGVRPTANSHVWEVVESKPGEEDVIHELSSRTGLYVEHTNGLPRCYTFLPPLEGKVPRLAIGHMWGVSLYELHPGKVVFVRSMSGHEGEVMALAPSAKGNLLYTASRDQTIACWSLAAWPHQNELGAGFRIEKGDVIVAGVDPGSPAWEMGLTDGDEIVLVLSKDRDGPGAFLFDPEGAGVAKYGLRLAPKMRPFDHDALLKHFEQAEPAREYIFVWRHGGKDAPWTRGLTTLPQRPLWRFFPTRQEEGSQWVLWRWRDYYYDTMSPRPDNLLGWHVWDETDLKITPSFHRLAHFGGRRDLRGTAVAGFHDPDRIWTFIANTNQKPEKVIFPAIEPPRIEITTIAPAPDKDNDLKLRVQITPHNLGAPLQQIARVVLWLDDVRYAQLWRINATGAVAEDLVIPRARLRQNSNRIKVVAFNAEGGRAEQSLVVPFFDPTRPKPTLRGLCIGIDKYQKVKPSPEYDRPDDLNFSVADAKLMDRVLRQQAKSHLFEQSQIEDALLDDMATVKEVKARLSQLGKVVGPDDWFVLFLSGHGLNNKDMGGFCYICADSNLGDRTTLLSAADLQSILANIPCRKLIFLDACHSGQVANSPIRGLNKDGVEFRIFSACKPHQPAQEPTQAAVKAMKEEVRPQGLFTQSLMVTLGYPEEGRKGRPNAVTDRELADKVCERMRYLLKRLKLAETAQEPEFYPERREMRNLQMLSRP